MNEDISYVSLSLQKYNELYDKAKAYDELTVNKTESTNDLLSELEQNGPQIGDRVDVTELRKGIGTITRVDEELGVYIEFDLDCYADCWYSLSEIVFIKESE